MRKIWFVLLIMIFLLNGCVTDPATYYFNADEIVEKATRIELVMCENNNPIIVTVQDNTILHFDIDNVTFIKELEQEKIDDFACDISTLTFHVERKSVNSPLGYTVLIYMENQEVIVLSCTVVDGCAYGMAAIFTIEGDFIRHIAQFADEPKFHNILEKYFEI